MRRARATRPPLFLKLARKQGFNTLKVYSSVDLDKHHRSTFLRRSLYRRKLPSRQSLLFGVFCCLFRYQRRLPALLRVSGSFIGRTHIQRNRNPQNRRCDFRGAPSLFRTSIAAATRPKYVWQFICPTTRPISKHFNGLYGIYSEKYKPYRTS